MVTSFCHSGRPTRFKPYYILIMKPIMKGFGTFFCYESAETDRSGPTAGSGWQDGRRGASHHAAAEIPGGGEPLQVAGLVTFVSYAACRMSRITLHFGYLGPLEKLPIFDFTFSLHKYCCGSGHQRTKHLAVDLAWAFKKISKFLFYI